MSPLPILHVTDLVKHFPVRKQSVFQRHREFVRAVDGVSLSIDAGKTLGLVGESGCGKSTLGKLIVRLETATAGSIQFQGEDLLWAGRMQMRRLRRNIQIIFQDPYASLNP